MAAELTEGRIAALYQHPVKGFTPEPIAAAQLQGGAHFPNDRLYAVEIGPCGFNPDAPAHISKQKFAVLARLAQVARVRTAYDAERATFTVAAKGYTSLTADLRSDEGRKALAAWLAEALQISEEEGVLQVLSAPQGHRFMDHPRGMVSVLNLASVRDLEQRIGRAVDPLRFRANVHVEGWPAWIENTPGLGPVALGDAACTVVKPIVRCVATHVDPATGEKDIEITKSLFEQYGHLHCGLYVEVERGGRLAVGDGARATAGTTH